MTNRLIFTLLAFMTGGSATTLEGPKYAVLAEKASYEVRDYEPYLVAEVDVRGRSADSRGVRTLAGYIFGDNQPVKIGRRQYGAPGTVELARYNSPSRPGSRGGMNSSFP